MIVYYNGEFLRKEDVAISPDDRGFLFADGVYDVIHAYSGRLFRCEDHLARLNHGLHELQIRQFDTRTLKEVAQRLLAENQLETGEALVYMQVTRGAAPRNHAFPPEGTSPTVYMQARAYSPPRELQQNGATAILVPDQRWARCDIKSISLLPNVLAHQKAREAGAFEAIFSSGGLL